MRIKTIKGHLTQTEKKHIRAILEAGLMEGKINRKTYFISNNENHYSVKIIQNEWSDSAGEIIPQSSTHQFSI